MEIVSTLDKRKKKNCISQNVKLLICIQLQNSSSNSKSEQWEISIHTHTKKQQPCFPPDKHRNLLFSDGFHQIELEEVLNSKVILWCLRVRTHLQTQLVTQQSSFFKQLGPVLLGLTESDWLLTGSLHCVESPVEVRRAGSVLEVRGQGSNQGRKLLTPCADTYEFCSNNLTLLPFPSPQYFLIMSMSQGRKRSSVWISI